MRKHCLIVGLIIALLAPGMTFAETVQEEPSALAMTGDLLFLRPVLLAVTVVGAAVYVVSLPFSLPGGNAKQAAKTLVGGPAVATFVRCLGCVRSGYAWSPVNE